MLGTKTRGRAFMAESRPLDSYYDTVYADQRADNASRPGPAPAVPSDGGNPVSGPHAFKYHERPRIPLMDSVPPEVLLAPVAGGGDPLQRPEEDEPEPFQKDAETQTMYRESEAQTDPYSPEYSLDPSLPLPEVLMLQELTYGEGLPVGRREVEMFEHARAKRRLQMSLPPFTDEIALRLRKRLMEEQELRELSLREKELDDARQQRIELLAQALEERDLRHEYQVQERIDVMRQQVVGYTRQLHSKMQNQRMKVLRKIARSRNAMRVPGDRQMDYSSRDIVKDYADFSSSVYAPLQRDGRSMRCSKPLARTSPHAAAISAGWGSVDSVIQLESSVLGSGVLSKRYGKTSSRQVPSPGKRKDQLMKQHLDLVSSLLAANKGRTSMMTESATLSKNTNHDAVAGARAETITNRSKTASSGERPPTPTIEDQSEDLYSQAIILLQRLLRGRAIQNTIYEGKERYKELIWDLRNAHEIAQDSTARQQIQQELEYQRTLRARRAALDALGGNVVGRFLRERSPSASHHKTEHDGLQEDIALTEDTIQNLVTSFLAPTVDRLSFNASALDQEMSADVKNQDETEKREPLVEDSAAG